MGGGNEYMASPSSTRAVSVRLLSDRGLSPPAIVYLNSGEGAGNGIEWKNAIATMAGALHGKVPALRSEINMTPHGASAARLHILKDGHVDEVAPAQINARVANDARLVLTFSGANCGAVLKALSATSSSGMRPNSIRHERTISGNAIAKTGLGKRHYRSYTTRLRVASSLYQNGSISQDEKALLKDLVIAGDRYLEDLLQNFESDKNPAPLLAFLRSPQAQAAKTRAKSNLMDSLASMSIDGSVRPDGLGSMDILMMEGIGEDAMKMRGDGLSVGRPGAGGPGHHASDVSFDLDFLANPEQQDISKIFDDGFDDPLNGIFPIDGRGSMDVNMATGIEQRSISSSTPSIVAAQDNRPFPSAPSAPQTGSSLHNRAASGSLGLIGFDLAKEARLRRFRRSFSDTLPNAVDLYDLIADPDCGVTVKPRTKRKLFKTEEFPPCFVGAEAVTWMTENIPVLYDDREKAVDLGKMLVRARLIAHVKNSKDFKDSPGEYYVFQKTREEVGLPTTTSSAIAAAVTGQNAKAGSHSRDLA